MEVDFGVQEGVLLLHAKLLCVPEYKWELYTFLLLDSLEEVKSYHKTPEPLKALKSVIAKLWDYRLMP